MECCVIFFISDFSREHLVAKVLEVKEEKMALW